MAYTMAYTPDPDGDMSRRGYKTGSLFQRCEARYGCPPLVDGVRPKHSCKGRWFGTIEVGYTASGTRRRITVSHAKKSVVQRRLRDKDAEIKAAGRASVRRTVTVARWAPQWLDMIQPRVRPSAYETDKAAMRYVVKTIGQAKLADLTPADVRSVARAIRSGGANSSTALRYHGSLMRMLKAAALDGYNIAPNVLLTEKPTEAVSDREAVSEAHIAVLMPHIAELPDGSRWVLAFLQGLRQGEALGLTWEQVDLDACTLTISWQAKSLRYRERANPAAGFVVPDGYEARHLVGAVHLVRPKSKAGWRVQPLVPWAVNALRAWREVAPANPHGLVWPGRTTKAGTWPRNPAADRDQWEAIQKACKVAHSSGRPYKVHEIRHATATLLMRLKVPESVRVAIMGHSRITVTQGYEHVDLTQARAALEQASSELGLS
jgi:integrase